MLLHLSAYGDRLFELFCRCNMWVTHSDKRVTKSLRKSRDNWRKQQLGVILSIYCFWFFSLSHCRASMPSFSYRSQPILTYNSHENIFQSTKVYHNCSSVHPFSSILSTWPLCYRLTLRGHNFSLALCTVSKVTSNWSSLIGLCVGVNNSECPNWLFVTLLSERVT